jgi:hypothetical protein
MSPSITRYIISIVPSPEKIVADLSFKYTNFYSPLYFLKSITNPESKLTERNIYSKGE